MASNLSVCFRSKVHKLANLVEHRLDMYPSCNEEPGIAPLLCTLTRLPLGDGLIDESEISVQSQLVWDHIDFHKM